MANKNNMNNGDCEILHSSTKNANDSFLNYNKNRTSGSSFIDLAIKNIQIHLIKVKFYYL